MKKALLIVIVFFCCRVASAQYNYYKLSIGATGGVDFYFGDIVTKPRILPAGTANFDYHITPYISVGAEYQKGILSAGDSILDPHGRYFRNEYNAFAVRGSIQLGQLGDFDHNQFLYAFKGFYIGTGVGKILNNQTLIKRYKTNPDGNLYTFPGQNVTNEWFIPANIGINYYGFTDYWDYTRYSLNINYQFNVTFGENLDGYSDPKSKFRNFAPDMYGILSLGFRYYFGTVGFY